MTTLPLTPDELLTTTRSVRKRLGLERPVPLELVRECLDIALQAPSGSNRQGWHWIVVTDADTRRAIGDVYRRAVGAYLHSSGAAGRLFADHAYLGEHLGDAPVLVLPCLTVHRLGAGNQAGTWATLLPAARSYMLAARAWPGHRVDDAAPDPRGRGRRDPRAPVRRPPGRPHPDRVLHRRDVPARTAGAARRGAPRRPVVIRPGR